MRKLLSEAIIQGIEYYPRSLNSGWMKGDMACALGAALGGHHGGRYGIWVLPDGFRGFDELADSIWPYLRRQVTVPDGVEIRSTTLMVAIMELNDNRKWKRERIARWVAGLEREWGLAPEPETKEEEYEAALV